MLDKLVELTNINVEVHVFCFPYSDGWMVSLEKKVEGTKLEIKKINKDLNEAIIDAYSAWIAATRSIPTHNLNQIEYVTPAPKDLDDEIPF